MLRSTIPNALDGALPRHKPTTSAQWDAPCLRQGITPTHSAFTINEALTSCLHSYEFTARICSTSVGLEMQHRNHLCSGDPG
jgi:hypothetical protein